MEATVALARRYLGDPVPIPGFEDLKLWVRPRKFSQHGRDEINAALIPRKLLLEKIKKSGEDLALTPAELELLGLETIMRRQLMYGLAGHNFNGEEQAPTEAWLSEVLEDPELATALLEIVKGYNAPLPKTTSDSSETSSNGDSKESPSTRT